MKRLLKFLSVLFCGLWVVAIFSPIMAQEYNIANDSLNAEFKSVETGKKEIKLPFGSSLKKERVTGAVTQINPEAILRYDNNQNVLDALRARVPGLMGATNIRGYGGALVVVNGIPRPTETLNLQEVESITVLRGATASVLYGSQGANGVILINTKHGKAGEFQQNIIADYGIGDPISYPEYLNSKKYMQLYNEALISDGLPKLYGQNEIDHYDNNSNSVKYPNQSYLNNTFLSNYKPFADILAEFSGGSKTAQYYLNMGYERSGTLVKIGEGKNEKNQDFKLRGRISFDLNNIINPYMEARVDFNRSQSSTGAFWQNVASSATRPNLYKARIPVKSLPKNMKKGADLINGKYVAGGTNQYQQTPYADLMLGGFNNGTRRLLQFNTGIDFNLDQFISGMKVRTNMSFDVGNNWVEQLVNQYPVYEYSAGNYNKIGKSRPVSNPSSTDETFKRRYAFSGVMDYDPNLSEINKLDITGVIYLERILDDQSGVQTPQSHHFALNANYMYRKKYIIDLAGAYIGSDKLPDGNRWSLSPSLGVGWIVSREDFLKKIAPVNYLKLSANWGILKSDQNFGYRLYENTYVRQGFSTFGDGTLSNDGIAINTINNPNLSFEKKRHSNINLDASLFQNRISLHTGFFQEKYYDQIVRPVNKFPAYLADNVAYQNYGENKRQGVEIGLGYHDTFDEIKIGIGANLIYSNSKVEKIDEPRYNNEYRSRVGNPTDAIYGYVAEGLFRGTPDIKNHADQSFGDVRPGDIKYKDLNNDGVIDERDQRMIGNYNDRLQYDLYMNIGYRNFNLFIRGTAQSGGDSIFDSDYYWADANDKYSAEVLDRWTPVNRDASYPRLTTENSSNNYRNSTYWLEQRNSININRIQLSYNFNLKSINDGTDIQLYLSASNLLTISKIKDELNLNIGAPPQMRYYSLGLKLSFNH